MQARKIARKDEESKSQRRDSLCELPVSEMTPVPEVSNGPSSFDSPQNQKQNLLLRSRRKIYH